MRYLLKKTGILVVTLLLISLLAFLAFQIIPGDPVTKLLGNDYTPERAASLRAEMGLDRNVFVRYWDWLTGFVAGDMGDSYIYGMGVERVMEGKGTVTAGLSLMAWLMVIAISTPLGILLARWQGGRLDRVCVAMNQVFMAIPPFFMGILFTYVFGLVLKLFMPGRFISIQDSFWGFWGYLVFPALAIAIPKAAMVTKLLRTSILNQMKEDYVRTAYSRGNSRWATLRLHVLRNAILPVITFVAMTLADIVAGSIIVEQVFVLPGLGRLLLASISNRDYPVVQCIVVIIAFVVVFMNYLADIVTQYIDPRIRLD